MANRKYIYIGQIPDIGGYGICVASLTEDGAMKALKKEYNKGDWERSFEESLEWWGGGVTKIELEKGYSDNFNY